MRLWLELNQQEGERLFDLVKDFTVDRMQTGVVSAKKDKPNEQAVNEEKEASSQVKPPETEKAITIEHVRAVLAEKSQSGKQPQVKELITKFGAKKLTDIDTAKYPELLEEAEEL